VVRVAPGVGECGPPFFLGEGEDRGGGEQGAGEEGEGGAHFDRVTSFFLFISFLKFFKEGDRLRIGYRVRVAAVTKVGFLEKRMWVCLF